MAEITATECPVSLITVESKRYVRVLDRHLPAGVTMYGDAVRWPARELSAAVVIEQERGRMENARIEQETKHG